MGKYEVTIGEWKKVMGDIPGLLKSDDVKFRESDLQPIIYVSWDDAKAFIDKLNENKDGFEYSLPSEAQWEYAARGGTETEFAFGDTLLPTQANCSESKLEKTMEVGFYKPNGFGLYDMHGNVWEWVEDIYSRSYAFRALPTDGSANLSLGDSKYRVRRGGSWSSDGNDCRSAYRNWNEPETRNFNFGLRVVARAK